MKLYLKRILLSAKNNCINSPCQTELLDAFLCHSVCVNQNWHFDFKNQKYAFLDLPLKQFSRNKPHNWPKNVHFSKKFRKFQTLKRFSRNKPHNLIQNVPKTCIFRNFQTHYLGWTLCLWYLPMSQKSTEFFLDLPVKRFSRNKSLKLTQNGPKTCIFRNFQNPSIKTTLCLWCLPMPKKSP